MGRKTDDDFVSLLPVIENKRHRFPVSGNILLSIHLLNVCISSSFSTLDAMATALPGIPSGPGAVCLEFILLADLDSS